MELVEEFCSAAESGAASSSQSTAYLVNSVVEVDLAPRAALRHRYVVTEGGEGVHMRTTAVQQAERSEYECTEVRLGGHWTRHDLNVQQTGKEVRHEIERG